MMPAARQHPAAALVMELEQAGIVLETDGVQVRAIGDLTYDQLERLRHWESVLAQILVANLTKPCCYRDHTTVWEGIDLQLICATCHPPVNGEPVRELASPRREAVTV
jgi:hypothetical protein